MAAVEEPVGAAEEEVFDERFEYDAPMFYDFDEGSPAGAPADHWFDTEGPKGLVTPPCPPAANEHDGAKPAQGAAAGAAEHGAQQQQQQQQGEAPKSKGKEWRRALASITNTKAQQPANAVAPAGAKAKQASKPSAAAAAAAAAGGGEGPAGAGGTRRRPASAKAQQQQQQPAAAAAAATTTHAAASRRVAAPSSKRRQHAVTVARSPQLRSLQRAHPGQQKTSEQLELERVQREKEEAAALRRRNAVAVKSVLAPPPPPVAHSSRPLTEPVGVELCTSKRSRMHVMETRSMASPYKSTAEQIAAFEGRRPGKTRLHGEGSGSAAAAAAAEGKQVPHQVHRGAATLTVPHSPRFATKKRVRPPRFKPREEVEAEEMAAMPKFKARPVNKRIMQDRSGHLGVPHVDTKPPTVPAPFALKTDQRAAEHHPTSAGDGDVFVFGAQGDGGRVTRSKAARKATAAGAGSMWTGQLTQPEPFRLATDARGATKRSAATEPHQEQHDVRPSKRARKAPAGPFHLATDARGVAEQERLEGVRQQQEEAARREAEFKALPLNKAALAGAWKPAPLAIASLTVPQDVHLRSDARAAQRRQFKATRVDAMEVEEVEQAAQPEWQ